MAEVVGSAAGLRKDQLPLMAVVNTTSPLNNDPGELDAFFEYLRPGVPIMIAPEVQAGATAPATIAGALVQATAEFLALACVAQLVNPGNPLVYGTVSSVFDMKKMMLPYGAPEADLFSIATAQIARYYGIPSRGTGGSSDANAIGTQTGVESLMSNLSCLLAGVTYVNHSGGELENTLSSSYEKTILDHEIISMAKRLVRGVVIDRETLALEVIKSVGHGGDYLSSEHALTHYRNEQFMPLVMDRDRHDIWVKAGGKRAEERAKYMVNDLLQKWEPYPLPEGASRELRRIYESVVTSRS